MVRVGRGDGAAFETRYRRHEARVFRFLLRTLRDEAGANDVMQDVWFAVARGAGRQAALGDAVVDHYVHAAEWEQGEYDRRVTDWELQRGFERS